MQAAKADAAAATSAARAAAATAAAAAGTAPAYFEAEANTDGGVASILLPRGSTAADAAKERERNHQLQGSPKRPGGLLKRKNRDLVEALSSCCQVLAVALELLDALRMAKVRVFLLHLAVFSFLSFSISFPLCEHVFV